MSIIPVPPYIKGKGACFNPIVKYGIPAYANTKDNPKVKGTQAWREFWEEQLYYIHNGVQIGGLFIPGRFYYYMNYAVMGSLEKGVITPDMCDLHLELAYLIDHAKLNGKNIICAKGRRKGISEFTHKAVIDYGWRFTYGYKSGVVSGKSKYVEEFISKWEFGEKYLPSELKVQHSGGKKITSGYEQKNELGAWETQGTQNIILSETVHTDPNPLKGYYFNDVVVEEVGETEKFEAFYGATIDALMSGTKQVGTMFAYGCVCAGTKVWDNEGNFVNIEDLDRSKGIIGYNENKGIFSKEDITYWQPPALKPCYKITTNTGRVLECSEDHPILVREMFPSRGHSNKKIFKETKDLVVGELLATIEEVNIWGNKKMFDPKLIGWLVGDGTYGKGQNATLCNADKDIWDYIEEWYEVVDQCEPALTKDGRSLRKARILGGVVTELEELGLRGQTKDNKRLPKDLHSFSKEDVCEFLGGYFDADGCAYTNDKTTETFLKLTSANYEILNETRFILQKLGIRCNVTFEKPNFNNPKTTRGHYNLIIKDKKSILKFAENIKFNIKYKQERLERGIVNLKNVTTRVSEKHKGLRFETIISVDYIGIKQIYNLTAGTTNTYVANGIVTHNTGGNIDKGSKGFKYAWEHPDEFNAIKFLVPATRFYFFGGADLPQRRLPIETDLYKTHKAYQLIGVEDYALSEKDILERREKAKKSGNLKKYNEELQNNPLTEREIFKKTNANNFDLDKLTEQSAEISALTSPKYSKYKLEWVKDDKGMIVTPRRVTITPLKFGEDETMCVYIRDDAHPKKTWKHVFVAGIDSYDQDTSKTSKSLGAMCVMTREHTISGLPRKVPVACIRTRPPRKEMFYDLCLMLSVYFDIKNNVLIDVRCPAIIPWFKDRGGEVYLAKRPVKFEKEDTSQGHDYGVSLNIYSKALMVGIMQTHIYDYSKEIWFNSDLDQGPNLINELLDYDIQTIDSDNDLADAYGMALMQDISADVKPRDTTFLKRDDTWDLPEFTQDGQMKHERPNLEDPEQDHDMFGKELFG